MCQKFPEGVFLNFEAKNSRIFRTNQRFSRCIFVEGACWERGGHIPAGRVSGRRPELFSGHLRYKNVFFLYLRCFFPPAIIKKCSHYLSRLQKKLGRFYLSPTLIFTKATRSRCNFGRRTLPHMYLGDREKKKGTRKKKTLPTRKKKNTPLCVVLFCLWVSKTAGNGRLRNDQNHQSIRACRRAAKWGPRCDMEFDLRSMGGKGQARREAEVEAL